MKKSLFMMALGAIVALTSCQHEQSQLDLGAVSETATVQGYVFINQGYAQDGATFVAQSIPAEGCGVLVKVPYTAYDADAADGYKYFEAECNAEGFYQIQIPVGQAPISGVKVYTRPIVAKYYDLENGKIVEKNASYPEVSAPVEVERGKLFTADPLYVYAENVNDKALVKGYVYINKGYVKDGSSYVVKSLPAEKVDVLVTVDDVTFVAITDNKGFYNLEIPVEQSGASAKVATRPMIDKYYDLINDEIVELEASYDAATTTATLKQGQLTLVADLTIQNPNTKQILTRNQSLTLKGEVKEWYEAKEWIDPNDQTLGYYAIADTREAAPQVKLVVTFTNTKFANEEIVYNITTDAEGKYELNAKLYDAWDIADTNVKVESKSYVSALIHYYQQWSEDDLEWKPKTQEVSGYFSGTQVTKSLSDGDLLIGTKMANMVLDFTPDKDSNQIRGIYYYDNYMGMYYDEPVGGVDTFRSWNPLEW